MKFLEKFDFNKEEIADFLNNSPKKLIDVIKEHKKLVSENLYNNNFYELLEYYDMFLNDHSHFVSIFSKYEPEDLIAKLAKNIKVVEYL